MENIDNLCENCMEKFVRNKYYDYAKDETCPHECRHKIICLYCVNYKFKDEALKVYLLKRKLKRELATYEEHSSELETVNTNIRTCISQLKDLSNRLNQSSINIDEIRKIINDCEVKYNMLYQTTCMKRAQSQEEPTEEFWPHKDFILPQISSYRYSEIWKISCSSCYKNLTENDLINNLICGHSLCDGCLPEPSCTICQHDQNSEVKLKENVIIYVAALLKKFEKKKIEFDKHTEDLRKASKLIHAGDRSLSQSWELCITENTDLIKEVRRKIVRWEYKLKTIDITICKTKGPGKSHNTLLIYDYEWQHGLSCISSYLHETFHLVKNGHKVFVMTKVNGHFKFGEFSSDENHLFLHAMTFNIPKDEAYFAELSQLKICAGNLRFSFMTINCNKHNLRFRFVIKLSDPHIAHRFVNSFIGEGRHSYINSLYQRGTLRNNCLESILYFPTDFPAKEKEIFDLDELTINQGDQLECVPSQCFKKGDIFIIELLDGSFSICRSLRNKLMIKSFGKVISVDKFSQIDFEDSSVLKVVDCGLQILHF